MRILMITFAAAFLGTMALRVPGHCDYRESLSPATVVLALVAISVSQDIEHRRNTLRESGIHHASPYGFGDPCICARVFHLRRCCHPFLGCFTFGLQAI